jgi:membrane peptidoglycan carboxypeptidase
MATYYIIIRQEVVQAMNPQTAYVMTYMLKGVIDEGTGYRLARDNLYETPSAVKQVQPMITLTVGLWA